MKRKTIFQTLDNKENPDEIESQGPFENLGWEMDIIFGIRLSN